LSVSEASDTKRSSDKGEENRRRDLGVGIEVSAFNNPESLILLGKSVLIRRSDFKEVVVGGAG